MSDDEANIPQGLPGDNSGSFTDQSYLTYLVPSQTNINLDEAFKFVEPGKSVLESIPQRKTLFFGTSFPLPLLQYPALTSFPLLTLFLTDETVQVLLVLKTPWVEEKDLQSSLQRLMISLAAHVVNSAAAGNRDTATPASESIFVGAVGDISDPFIVVEARSRAQGGVIFRFRRRRQLLRRIWGRLRRSCSKGGGMG
ncbi:hypothetical protein NQ176_g5872 [Zarea fungicola]|uniref:Uncharacterized protein n=1 Tax=Zarea fungicola TaxID=93591 RepID=A0ACC1N6B2_9HYPO|nr:hypothetical protein NQ176_g5872 [Lecanicillium fungicola]